ncbi:MAG TPA: VOC family protein, partial [Candidatus Angelobacter sp.]|nr:VOC family protein [Candidatus Angelobacter sp.]
WSFVEGLQLIRGMHGLFYTPNAEEVRAFIRDKLGFAHNDIGEGWLIFDIPEADLGVHPSDAAHHSISFYCDDIHKTVEDLRSRGVEFSSGIADEPWGHLTHFLMPGNLEVELYQPKYEKRVIRRRSNARPHPKNPSRKRNARR